MKRARWNEFVYRLVHGAVRALRENFLPGLVLQAAMLAGVALYLFHDGFRSGLEAVAEIRRQSGFVFAFVSYAVAGAALPEILKIVCFQGFRFHRTNVLDFSVAFPFWGLFGLLIDLLYRLQQFLFGAGNEPVVVLKKVAFDQLIFSPFIGTPITLLYFAWAAGAFRPSALLRAAAFPGFAVRVLAVQMAGWMVWIPAVVIIYSLPPLLQIPVAVTFTAFWVLILTTIRHRQESEL